MKRRTLFQVLGGLVVGLLVKVSPGLGYRVRRYFLPWRHLEPVAITYAGDEPALLITEMTNKASSPHVNIADDKAYQAALEAADGIPDGSHGFNIPFVDANGHGPRWEENLLEIERSASKKIVDS